MGFIELSKPIKQDTTDKKFIKLIIVREAILNFMLYYNTSVAINVFHLNKLNINIRYIHQYLKIFYKLCVYFVRVNNFVWLVIST